MLKPNEKIVYLITDGYKLKIGTTTRKNLKKRLSTIQTGNPNKCRVLATIVGDREKEKELHDYFAKFRGNGEWFSMSRAILDTFRVDDATQLQLVVRPQLAKKHGVHELNVFDHPTFYRECAHQGLTVDETFDRWSKR
jgi:hypothetical protein